MLHAGYNLNLPWHRTLLFIDYVLGRAMNEADGALSLPSDSRDPHADWGPSPFDARHRLSGMFNMDLWKGLKLASSLSASSGLPYNVTTGFDDNDDTVSNDRPAGVSRNSARGGARWEVGGRVSWGFGFGRRDQVLVHQDQDLERFHPVRAPRDAGRCGGSSSSVR